MSAPRAQGAAGGDRLLACQRDPERWFDRRARTQALLGCLQCRARVGCARQALAVRPVFGMWAGIWIDHNLAEMSGYLRAIADEPPSATPAAPPDPSIPASDRSPLVGDPLVTPRISDARASVAAVIAARASGHCEVLALGCLLTAGAIVSRLPRRQASELSDPAAGYLCCQSCRGVVAQMQPRLARRLGYLVEARRDPGTVPFYWRQSRWVLLDSTGSARAVPHLDRPA